MRLHQNAQRLLEPIAAMNPYAAKLTFPDDRLSARRDHRKYLGLIRAVAFLHQHQRRREGGAIVVEPADIELANRLAHHTLGQSIYDLSAPSRRLLVELHEWLSERATRDGVALAAMRFSQREIRERVGWKRSQLAHHVRELVESEYLVVHTMPPGRKTRYALDWDGSGMDGRRFYRGLVDTTQLKAAATSGSLPGHFHGGTGRARKALRGQQDRVSGTPGVEGRER